MDLPGVDEWVKVGRFVWWAGCAAFVLGRGADMVSTWIATPRLELEGNPIARWVGWRWGLVLNLLFVSCWPTLAVAPSPTGLLVVALNLQHAWVIRFVGESGCRCWLPAHIVRSKAGLVLFCFLGEGALVGGGLVSDVCRALAHDEFWSRTWACRVLIHCRRVHYLVISALTLRGAPECDVFRRRSLKGMHPWNCV